VDESRRVVLRFGAVMLILAGLVSLAFAIRGSVQGAAEPKAVPVGRTVTLDGRTGLLGADRTLYGRAVPDPDDLDCTVRDRTGRRKAGFWPGSMEGDTRTVAGVRLTPLGKIANQGAGSTLVCRGAAATAAAPLYLLEGPGLPGIARVGMAGFAVVAGMVGLTGVLVLRRPGVRPPGAV
jgi:hypothetical protein